MPDEVAALEPEHVARFLASAEELRRPDGRSKRTRSLNALSSSLRGFFEYTERAGIVERSPARVLRLARVGATPPKGLTTIEVGSLRTVLAADTTARLGSALEVRDVDLSADTATLRELKGGGSMTVYLRPELVTLLTAAVGDRLGSSVGRPRRRLPGAPRSDWFPLRAPRERKSTHEPRTVRAFRTRDVDQREDSPGTQHADRGPRTRAAAVQKPVPTAKKASMIPMSRISMSRSNTSTETPPADR